ncbi:Type I restriction-modification system, specificity subunit S [Vibrio owensii]|uniref:restriction endonuclease subunit S n=1 Tax=Vibrio owensii TaxID=696485 RepID=UPI002893C794|nr:Type I restriction-modification system, specificity subunit S [Vibrio owensii]CAH1565271.1 Type I restriction-modification system, specificity subunit S [Vibrio owensii]
MSFDYELPDGWSWKTIEEVQESPKGATITGPFGSSIGKKFFVEKGVPVIRGNNLSLGMTPFIDDGFVYVSEEKADELKRYKSIADDLLFTAAGTIGQVGIIPKKSKYDEYIISNKQLRARLDTTVVDPTYAYYWFSSKPMVEYIKRQDTGSTIPLINLGVLRSLPLPVPPLDVQVRIRRILKSFDKKIWINTQTNQTLEQMAQAIFKSWFVDFDPVKAKMNGEQPEGMDAATASLFPEKLDSDTGLPEGWKLSEIGDEVAVVGGGTPSKKNDDFWVDGHVHWTSPKDLSGVQDKVLLDTASKLTEAGLKKVSSGLLPVDTVLLSSRAPVGYLALAKVPLAVNQGYIAMKCEKTLSPEFVLQWCVHRMDEIKQRASGSTFAEISKKNFKPISVVVPSEDVLSAYQKLVTPLYDAITANVRQSEQLSNLRDTLLPKLLSGEVKLEQENHLTGALA